MTINKWKPKKNIPARHYERQTRWNKKANVPRVWLSYFWRCFAFAKDQIKNARITQGLYKKTSLCFFLCFFIIDSCFFAHRRFCGSPLFTFALFQNALFLLGPRNWGRFHGIAMLYELLLPLRHFFASLLYPLEPFFSKGCHILFFCNKETFCKIYSTITFKP